MQKLKSACLRILFIGAIISLNFAKACGCIEPIIGSYHVGIGYYRWPIAIIGVLFLIEALGFRFLTKYKKNDVKLWKLIISTIIFPMISIFLGGFLVIALDMYDIVSLLAMFLCFFACEAILIKNLLKTNRPRSLEASFVCNCVFILLMISTFF